MELTNDQQCCCCDNAIATMECDGYEYCAACWAIVREGHASGCVCADCSSATLSAEND